jgi:gliding motility-associated-like protein
MRALFALFLLTISLNSTAQRVLWNNALMYIGDSSLVYVNGNAEINGPSTLLINKGKLDLNNSVQPGTVYLENASQTSGNGDYDLEGDWVNNAVFQCDSSHVHLNGDNQLITGSNITTYWVLETSNAGVKTQTLDARVKEQLLLNDRELATGDFTLTVLNSDTVSVQNTLIFGQEGFVSSTNSGGLVRHMSQTRAYRFPVGDDIGTRRYRCYTLAPNSAGYQVFRVGFRHFDATTAGFDIAQLDSSLCRVNNQFWHRVVLDSGTVLVNDVTMTFDPIADGLFTTNAQWQPTALWTDIGNPLVQSGNYVRITSTAHSDFGQEAYALALITPAAPQIVGDTIICDSTQWLTYYSPFVAGTSYNWIIPPGAGYTGQGSADIDVNWSGTSGGGTLGLQTTDALGCTSFPAYVNAVISTLSAAFDTLSAAGAGEYEFFNTSADASSFEWMFGDGSMSNETSPLHTFPVVGDYPVVLVATDALGCSDTALLVLTVLPDFFIPNIITPNGDNLNDMFQISALGIESFSVSIQNRWGKEIFRADTPDIVWDGNNFWSGEPCSEGTYFYILEGKAGSNTYFRKGFVTLVRD